MEAAVNMYRNLIKEKNEVALKRAELTGRVFTAAAYLDMILTPEQKEHFSYKSLSESINDLQDSYYVREEEEEELAL